jgi:hypothetical protein
MFPSVPQVRQLPSWSGSSNYTRKARYGQTDLEGITAPPQPVGVWGLLRFRARGKRKS